MDFTLYSHLSYLAIAVALTVWVARALHRMGRLYLVDVYGGKEDVADSVNGLLVMGFYLVSIGIFSLALQAGAPPRSAAGLVEFLSWKIGLVLLILGAMHFMNLATFARIRERRRLENAPPPVSPDERASATGA
jgi:hypothetical protein